MANYWENGDRPTESDSTGSGAFGTNYQQDDTARANAQSFASGYNNTYAAPPTVPAGQQPPRKPRKPGAGLVAICAIAALIFSFAGTFAANRLFPSENPSNGGQSSIVESAGHLNDHVDSTSSLSAVVDETKSSVVEITTESTKTNSLFGGSYVTEGAGSGVVISADGYIVTNNHVVSGASTINVTLSDGAQYAATLVGTDSKTDLAVVKINATGLTPATFGDSSELAVGDAVIAIGNPLGSLGGTVTNGIVSALDREITIDGKTMSLIQTNAAVNPGNSGGGLFNVYGELVGIVNAKSGSDSTSSTTIEGLGFAIPSNTVKEVALELMNNGYVTGRVALGIKVIEVADQQTAAQYGVDRAGVYIAEITDGLGAQKAGLQVGDCIVSVNGTAVSATGDVTSELENFSVGDTIEVQVIRGGKMISFQVELSENVPETTAQAS